MADDDRKLADPRQVAAAEREVAFNSAVVVMTKGAPVEGSMSRGKRRDAIRILGKLGADDSPELIDLRDRAITHLAQFGVEVFVDRSAGNGADEIDLHDGLGHAVIAAITDENVRSHAAAIDALGQIACSSTGANANSATEALARVATDRDVDPANSKRALERLDVVGVRSRPSALMPLLSHLKTISAAPPTSDSEERTMTNKAFIARIIDVLENAYEEMDETSSLRAVVSKTIGFR